LDAFDLQTNDSHHMECVAGSQVALTLVAEEYFWRADTQEVVCVIAGCSSAWHQQHGIIRMASAADTLTLFLTIAQ
jgi:hypothetical protein